MYRLIILNIDENTLTLQDEDNKVYRKIIRFINTDYLPQTGDCIYLPEEILREENLYVYGKIYNKELDDIIKVETKKDVIYLQRYYG